MLKYNRGQRGITLVELMIASVIALITLSAVVTLYSATARHSAQHLQRTHLHQQLYALIHLMQRDLKRAGYWHFSPDHRSAAENPFQNTSNGLQISSYDGEEKNSCIVFSYDLDKDGLVGIGHCDGSGCVTATDDDNVELFGFRLRNRRLESRFGGAETGCNTGYWQSMNDPDIEITVLMFDEHSRCLNLLDHQKACSEESPALLQRAIELKLSGQLVNQPQTNMTLTHWVRIRNDQIREDG